MGYGGKYVLGIYLHLSPKSIHKKVSKIFTLLYYSFTIGRFIKILGDGILWGGNMVIQLDYRLMPWMWNGLRSVMREANRQGNAC